MPLQGTSYLNTAILIHIFFGVLMITNSKMYMTKDDPTNEIFIMP